MLLAGLVLVASLSTAQVGPPSPSAAAAAMESRRSQRSRDNPLSQSGVQPIQPTPCAENRPGCRHIDFFDFRSKTGVLRVEINADLDYIDSNNRLGLFPGEAVTVVLASSTPGSARMVFRSGGLAAAASGGEVAGAPPAGLQPAPVAVLSRESRPGPNEIRLSFVQTDGQADSLLTVQNGYDQQLGYSAQMRLPNGATQPTNVCQVLAHISSIETWPYPIAELVLGQMQLIAPRADGGLTC